jgi:hypothetical protein
VTLDIMKRKIALLPSLILGTLVLAAPIAASAATDSDNTTINASIQPVISISTSGTVNLSVTPTTAGTMTSASDTVDVTTNNATGYVLTLSDSNTDTSLVNGSNNITASVSTPTAPGALQNNTWGYRVDGIESFGAGPTAAESNVDSSTTTFAGVPASDGSAHTIKTSASAAATDQTVVWYGVKVDQTLPTGTYTNAVTYTATTQ